MNWKIIADVIKREVAYQWATRWHVSGEISFADLFLEYYTKEYS